MSLTEALIQKAKPREKPYKLSDGKGLCLLVNPTGSLWWRFRYRFDGKEKMLALGVYPKVSLKEARKKRDEARDKARDKVKSGVDPSEERREVKRNAIKQNKITFRLTLSYSGDLTIMTPIRTITLNPAQTEALRAFLIAASTEKMENPC